MAENVFRVSSLEGQEHGQELLLVADEDGVRDDGQLALHRLLDRHRGNVLASGRDQQLLDTTCKNIFLWRRPRINLKRQIHWIECCFLLSQTKL